MVKFKSVLRVLCFLIVSFQFTTECESFKSSGRADHSRGNSFTELDFKGFSPSKVMLECQCFQISYRTSYQVLIYTPRWRETNVCKVPKNTGEMHGERSNPNLKVGSLNWNRCGNCSGSKFLPDFSGSTVHVSSIG